jgi:hypothetical protein
MRWSPRKPAGSRLLSGDIEGLPAAGSVLGSDRVPPIPSYSSANHIEVVPHLRLFWTDDEVAEGAVNKITFEEQDGERLPLCHGLDISKDRRDEAFIGMDQPTAEQLAKLDTLLEFVSAESKS